MSCVTLKKGSAASCFPPSFISPGAVVKSWFLGELGAISAARLTRYGLWEALGCLCGGGRARGLLSLSKLYNVYLDAKAVSFGHRHKH